MIPHIPHIPYILNIDKYIMPAIDPQSNLIQKFKVVTEKLRAKINRISLRLSGESSKKMSNKKLLESFKERIDLLQRDCDELIFHADYNGGVISFDIMMYRRTESVTEQTLAAQKAIRKIEGKFGDPKLERELKSISKNLDLLAQTITSTFINKVHEIRQTKSAQIEQTLKELNELEAKVKEELSNDFGLFKNMKTTKWLKMIIKEQKKLTALYKIANPIFTPYDNCGRSYPDKIYELKCKLQGLDRLYDEKWSFFKKNKQNYYKN